MELMNSLSPEVITVTVKIVAMAEAELGTSLNKTIADKIKTHLLNRYNQEISAEEKTFLVIHISRLARN